MTMKHVPNVESSLLHYTLIEPAGTKAANNAPLASGNQERQASFYRVLDIKTIRNRAGYNVSNLSNMIEAFNKSLEQHLFSIDHAIQAGNAGALSDIANTLKSAIGHFSQQAAYDGAKQLEEIGKSGHLKEARKTFLMLKQHVYVLQFELLQFEQTEKEANR